MYKFIKIPTQQNINQFNSNKNSILNVLIPINLAMLEEYSQDAELLIAKKVSTLPLTVIMTFYLP